MAKPKAKKKAPARSTKAVAAQGPKRNFVRRPRKTGITQIHTGLMMNKEHRDALHEIADHQYYGNASMAARIIFGYGLEAFLAEHGTLGLSTLVELAAKSTDKAAGDEGQEQPPDWQEDGPNG